MRKVFENLTGSDQQSAISQNRPESCEKNGFDKAVIRLSNYGLTFVCNKTPTPGWGGINFATLSLTKPGAQPQTDTKESHGRRLAVLLVPAKTSAVFSSGRFLLGHQFRPRACTQCDEQTPPGSG
jgi:hypothetical protein